MVMLAEYGSMSLAEVLAPAMEMAEGYPIEAGAAGSMRSNRRADSGMDLLPGGLFHSP